MTSRHTDTEPTTINRNRMATHTAITAHTHRHRWGNTNTILTIGMVWAIILAVSLVLLSPQALRAQRGSRRQSSNANDEARFISETLTKLFDRVVNNESLLPVECKAISEEMDKSTRFMGSFDEQTKGELMLIRAWVAHFMGRGQEAINQAQKASRFLPDDQDVSDSLIVFGLCHRDFSLVQQILRERVPALTLPASTFQTDEAEEDEQADDDRTDYDNLKGDPNAPDSDPMASEDSPAAVDQGIASESSSRSPGDPNGPADASDTTGRHANRPANRESLLAEWRRPEETKKDQHEKSRQSTRRSSRRNRRRGSRDDDTDEDTLTIPAMKKMTGSGVLGLAVDHMPFDHLGKIVPPLQLKGFNGSTLTYRPETGQCLGVFLWEMEPFHLSMVEQEQPAGGSSRPQPGYSSYSPTPGMPSLPGMAGSASPSHSSRRSRSSRSVDTDIQPPAYDLDSNIDHLYGLFIEYIDNPAVLFAGLNLDPPRDRDDVLSHYLEDPHPWTECLISNPANNDWQLTSHLTPLLVIIDTNGQVRYQGPAGGFLPRLLLSTIAPKAPQRTVASDNPYDPAANTATGAANPNRPGSPTKPSQPPKANVPATVNNAPATSHPKASQMLQVAQVKQRMGQTISALELCDNILERYPNSLEAENAKMLIEKILSTNRNLRKLREREGRYTGS